MSDGGLSRRRRRPLPLRVKIALAGLAGVGVAWLLPRGGETPVSEPTVVPSDRAGVTAAQVRLATIPEGVSFRIIDGQRVFFSRRGPNLVAFLGVGTTAGGGPVWWCAKNRWFEGAAGTYYSATGVVLRYSAPRDLDIVAAQRAGETVTVFPHSVLRGSPAPPTPSPPPSLPAPPAPCSASERVG